VKGSLIIKAGIQCGSDSGLRVSGITCLLFWPVFSLGGFALSRARAGPADRVEVHQVLLNLTLNAFEATQLV